MTTKSSNIQSGRVSFKNVTTMEDSFLNSGASVVSLSDTSASSSSSFYVREGSSDALSESSKGSAERCLRIIEEEAETRMESRKLTKALRKVSWGSVEMRMYPIIPGDHPDTMQGPPVRSSIYEHC